MIIWDREMQPEKRSREDEACQKLDLDKSGENEMTIMKGLAPFIEIKKQNFMYF